MAILAISHVMKLTGYEHQNHKFRVFQQSLPVTQDKINRLRLQISKLPKKLKRGGFLFPFFKATTKDTQNGERIKDFI